MSALLNQMINVLPRHQAIALICSVDEIPHLGLEMAESAPLVVVNVDNPDFGAEILHEVKTAEMTLSSKLTLLLIDGGSEAVDRLHLYSILMDRCVGSVQLPAGFRLIIAGPLRERWDPCILDKMWVWLSGT